VVWCVGEIFFPGRLSREEHAKTNGREGKNGMRLTACALGLALLVLIREGVPTPDEDLRVVRRPFEHHVVFPPIQNASARARGRGQELPREALYAHGHGVRPVKTRHIDDEDYVCFRSPVLVALGRGQAMITFVEGRRISCDEHGGPHHILLRSSTDGGKTWAQSTDGTETDGGAYGVLVSANSSEHFGVTDSFRHPTPVVHASSPGQGPDQVQTVILLFNRIPGALNSAYDAFLRPEARETWMMRGSVESAPRGDEGVGGDLRITWSPPQNVTDTVQGECVGSSTKGSGRRTQTRVKDGGAASTAEDGVRAGEANGATVPVGAGRSGDVCASRQRSVLFSMGNSVGVQLGMGAVAGVKS
jgi:hypothetical protein